jgi:hypothetical protein
VFAPNPSAPRAPWLDTSAASSGVETPAIGEIKMGCLISNNSKIVIFFTYIIFIQHSLNA